MNRVSERISAVMTTVKCPSCGKFVTPTDKFVGGGEDEAKAEVPSESGARWSFLWVPPQGQLCPECDFPLARYARRAKWIRLFLGGIAMLTISLLLHVTNLMAASSSPALAWTARVLLTVGLVALLVGLIGIVIGGRRTDDRGSNPSATG